jgi:hypothetical protein
MKSSMSARATLAVLVLSAATAGAQPAQPDDGYCDFVEGTASANAATLASPELFSQFGYIEQPAFAITPTDTGNNLRALGGVRWSITNLLVSRTVKSVARAECRKHRAQLQLQGRENGVLGLAAGRALAAKLEVYEEAAAEAERILTEAQSELDNRRLTAPEAFATRMRVEDLRSAAAQTRMDLAAIPPQDPAKPITQAATDYAEADAALEHAQGHLRSLAAYDVSVRGGADRFLEGPDARTNYFAVIQVGVNFGAFATGSANRRAAAGRARYATTQVTPSDVGPNPDQVRAMIGVAETRAKQLQALVTDLEQQMSTLAQLSGEDSKRFRETLWFDTVKAKADLAYAQAQVTALRDLAGLK